MSLKAFPPQSMILLGPPPCPQLQECLGRGQLLGDGANRNTKPVGWVGGLSKHLQKAEGGTKTRAFKIQPPEVLLSQRLEFLRTTDSSPRKLSLYIISYLQFQQSSMDACKESLLSLDIWKNTQIDCSIQDSHPCHPRCVCVSSPCHHLLSENRATSPPLSLS